MKFSINVSKRVHSCTTKYIIPFISFIIDDISVLMYLFCMFFVNFYFYIVATNHCCHQSLLPPIIVATNHCCHQSLLPPITVATNHCCHQSLLPPITVATNHCCHQSLLPPITVATNHCCHQSLLPPITCLFTKF
jgi:hypothetical protein